MALKPYFEMDGVTLYFRDCLDLLPELQSGSFDLAMTDPPCLVSKWNWRCNLGCTRI